LLGCDPIGVADPNPVEQQASMALLLLPPGLTDGESRIGLGGEERRALLLQIEIGEEGQVPEAPDPPRRADLILVGAEDLLHIGDELLNGLTTSDKFCWSRFGQLRLRW
jgi:hypothetical protein